MTLKERIAQVEAENAELRTQVASLIISLAKALDSYQAVITTVPAPLPAPLPFSPPIPWYDPYRYGNTCISEIAA